ncbi:hypothetical protein ACOSQ3_023407 [Xanthoceras sorbifolium]
MGIYIKKIMALAVVLHRFGPTHYEDPSEALSRSRDDIRLDVKVKQPKNLADTIGVARLIEERNSL